MSRSVIVMDARISETVAAELFRIGVTCTRVIDCDLNATDASEFFGAGSPIGKVTVFAADGYGFDAKLRELEKRFGSCRLYYSVAGMRYAALLGRFFPGKVGVIWG